MRTRWRRGFVPLLMIGLLGALVPHAPARSAPAVNIEGNTYTSPTFGYTITWDDSWFIVEETSDAGGDYLAVTNATISAAFVGFEDFLGATACIASLATAIGRYGGLDDVEPLVGSNGAVILGGDSDHAFAAFTGTTTFEDGTTLDLAAYLDCRPIVPGESLLSLIAFMPVDSFGAQLPLVEALLTGVELPGAAQRSGTSGVGAGADDNGPNLGEESVLGEPAPVFAARGWRVAVVTTVRDQEIAVAGLEPKAGREWVVVVADVTNWSETDATFARDNLGLLFAGDSQPILPASNSSRATARALDLAVVDLAEGVSFEAGETVRLALVFLIPEESETPVLHGLVSEPGLPLNDENDAEDLLEIRPPAAPPAPQSVTVVNAIDGEVIELRITGSAEVVRARLIGVDAPADGDCFADLSTAQLIELVGQPAWIEGDPTERGGLSEKVYLWVENSSGVRVLVNVQQVADGYGVARELDEEARFAAWIGDADQTARAHRAGLWGSCEQENPSETAETVATNPPTPEPTPSPTSEPLADEVTIETSDIGYQPEQATIPADTDVTITIANSDAVEHTFTIAELNINILVPPGETETFTLNVPAGEYVFYCEQPGHRAAGMEGVLRAA